MGLNCMVLLQGKMNGATRWNSLNCLILQGLQAENKKICNIVLQDGNLWFYMTDLYGITS